MDMGEFEMPAEVPQRLGDLIDLKALRASFDRIAQRRREIEAEEAAERARLAAERRAEWQAMTPNERAGRRAGFLLRLGFQPDVARAAARNPLGSAEEERSQASDEVKAWTKSRLPGMSPRGKWAFGLLGACGIGKTYALARWCLWASGDAAETQIAVLTARQLADIDLFKQGDLVQWYASRKYLALDDLGSEFASDQFAVKFEAIVDYRNGHDLDMLFCGNFPAAKMLADRYGGRVMDRIGMASCKVLTDKRSRR